MYSRQATLLFHQAAEGAETPKDFDLSYQDLHFTSADKTLLHGWFIPDTSAIKQNKKIPLLYCHGNGATLSRLAHVTKIFNEYGFEPLLFTYRGFGSSEAGPLTQQGLIDDALAAYDTLQRLRSDTPIIAWGHSLGASICAAVGAQRPLAGLILEAPFTSVANIATLRYPWMPIFERFLQYPLSTIEFVKQKRETPLLVIHSKMDSIIPISQGRAVYEAAGKPKKFLELERIDHNDFPSVSEVYKEEIMDWVRNLPFKG